MQIICIRPKPLYNSVGKAGQSCPIGLIACYVCEMIQAGSPTIGTRVVAVAHDTFNKKSTKQ